VHPRRSKKQNLGGNFFLGGGELGRVEVGNLAVVAFVLRTSTKERSTFLGKIVHPRENPGYACVPFTVIWPK